MVELTYNQYLKRCVLVKDFQQFKKEIDNMKELAIKHLVQQPSLYSFIYNCNLLEHLKYLVDHEYIQKCKQFCEVQTSVENNNDFMHKKPKMSQEKMINKMFCQCALKEHFEMLQYIHLHLHPSKSNGQVYNHLFYPSKEQLTPKMIEMFEWLKSNMYVFPNQLLLNSPKCHLSFEMYKFQIENCNITVIPEHILEFAHTNNTKALEFGLRYLIKHPQLFELHYHDHYKFCYELCQYCDVQFDFGDYHCLHEYEANFMFLNFRKWLMTIELIAQDRQKFLNIFTRTIGNFLPGAFFTESYWECYCFRDFIFYLLKHNYFDYETPMDPYKWDYTRYQIQKKIEQYQDMLLQVQEILTDDLPQQVIQYVLNSYL